MIIFFSNPFRIQNTPMPNSGRVRLYGFAICGMNSLARTIGPATS
jgi:hypothetical protein